MSAKTTIVEEYTPLELLGPATDAAGRTSVYVKCAFAQRATIIVHVTQAAAATILLTPLQATNEEGGSSKVLSKNVPIWHCDDVVASSTFVRAADGVNFTTDAGQKDKIIVFQIDPEYLDQVNGFEAIGISTGASDATNITSALVQMQQRYRQPIPPE